VPPFPFILPLTAGACPSAPSLSSSRAPPLLCFVSNRRAAGRCPAYAAPLPPSNLQSICIEARPSSPPSILTVFPP
jgi:hypothetical protein